MGLVEAKMYTIYMEKTNIFNDNEDDDDDDVDNNDNNDNYDNNNDNIKPFCSGLNVLRQRQPAQICSLSPDRLQARWLSRTWPLVMPQSAATQYPRAPGWSPSSTAAIMITKHGETRTTSVLNAGLTTKGRYWNNRHSWPSLSVCVW